MVSLQFATMLFHIAAAAVLTNIAFMEIYSFYELADNIADNKLLSDKVKPNKIYRYSIFTTIATTNYLAIPYYS